MRRRPHSAVNIEAERRSPLCSGGVTPLTVQHVRAVLVHVTAGWFDVMGARHAGMQAAWVDRKSTPWDPFGLEPDLAVESLDELAEALGV